MLPDWRIFYFEIQKIHIILYKKTTFYSVDLKASETGQVHTKNFISHFWATSAVCCWFMLVIIFKSWCWYTVGFLGLLWWHKIVSRCSERYTKGSRKYQMRILVQSNFVIRNVLIRKKLVLRNIFPWPIVNLLHRDNEHLALRNNFRATKMFLITKFDCAILFSIYNEK